MASQKASRLSVPRREPKISELAVPDLAGQATSVGQYPPGRITFLSFLRRPSSIYETAPEEALTPIN